MSVPDSQLVDRGKFKLIDCDVHPVFAQDWPQVLADYFPAEWQIRFRSRDQVPGQWPGVRYLVPFNGSYPRGAAPLRGDLIGPDGSLPGTDPIKTSADLFDDRGIDRAILIDVDAVSGIGAMPDKEAASVIAAAINDWMIDKWFAADSRWRGCMAVAPQDVKRAVAEIERQAAETRFVGIFLSLGKVLMGDRHFYPLYEIAEHYGLALVVHPTGTPGLPTGPQLAGGTPQHHFEFRINQMNPYQANLVSLIAHGVFERFPELKVSFTECGFAWLPEVTWRMDAFWKGHREDTPWVKCLPSEYVTKHCRFTTQPFIEPRSHKHIAQILEMIQAEKTLMFSSDYPHWDSDEPLNIMREIPESIRPAVLVGNALDTYGDRLL